MFSRYHQTKRPSFRKLLVYWILTPWMTPTWFHTDHILLSWLDPWYHALTFASPRDWLHCQLAVSSSGPQGTSSGLSRRLSDIKCISGPLGRWDSCADACGMCLYIYICKYKYMIIYVSKSRITDQKWLVFCGSIDMCNWYFLDS